MRKKVLKKIIIAVTTYSILGLNTMTVFAGSVSDERAFYESYQKVIEVAQDYNVPIDMSFSEYKENYDSSYGSYDEYAKHYISLLKNNEEDLKSSGGDKYYYDTGTSCPAEATYDKYNLLDIVEKGDIIFEAAGGFGITGHIAIVEGIYPRTDCGKYIRLVEAGSFGVARSILDDTRYDEKEAMILRVKGATDNQKNAAVNFCISQLGKGYLIDFQKDTSADEKDWYCSELVWAGYKNQGIDIEVSGFNEPGITPRDIRNSELTQEIAVSEQ